MAEKPTAAVLGLGVLGASLALALRSTGRYAAVVGWDPDFDVFRARQKARVADRFTNAPTEAVRGAPAVFVAVSAAHLRDTLTNVAPHLAHGAVVCSLEEAHEPAQRIAAETLPANVSFVCANPVLWREVTADTEPSPALFEKGIFSLTPSAAAHPDAVAYVADVAGALGMETYFVDAREHDAFVAGINRLPAVLAATLLRTATRQSSWRELSRLAGAQFRRATEPVSLDPARQQEELAAGRDHLVRWLADVIDDLAGLRDALKDGREPEDYFAAAADARAKWLHDRQIPASVSELPRTDLSPTAPKPPRRGLFR